MPLNVTNSARAVGLASARFDEGIFYDGRSSPWYLNESLPELSLDASCCSLFPGNDSRGAYWQTRSNVTAHLTTYEVLRAKLNNVIMPSICLFGLIGNSFSIYVFSRRWLTKYIDQLERSASTGLVSLALSDLSFCLVSIPALFLRNSSARSVENNVWNVLALYYVNFRSPLTNLFLLNSTWIIVVISLERFVAVSYAIKARWLIRVRVTVLVHSAVFLASFVLCLPLMLRNRIQTTVCPNNNHVCLHVATWGPLNDEHFRFVYKVVWTSVGTFVPLTLLVATSVRLLVDLYRSKAFGLADADRYGTTQITTMVAAILLTFVALVCPSMVVECLGWFWFSRRGGSHSPEGDFRFWQAMLVTNLLEAIKFSSNFLLYCAVSREFRKNFNFRRLRDSLTARARPNRKRMTSQRVTDGSTASACQLTVIQALSRGATSQEGKELAKCT